jgi:hypothetical protein
MPTLSEIAVIIINTLGYFDEAGNCLNFKPSFPMRLSTAAYLFSLGITNEISQGFDKPANDRPCALSKLDELKLQV